MDPLHHFEVHNYVDLSMFGLDISISNSVVWMWVAVACAFGFFKYAFRDPKVVPGRAQLLAETGFLFIRQLVEEMIGKEGRKYFPAILTLFFFVLFCNLVGVIPSSYTPTSQLIVTGTLAIVIFFLCTLLGFAKHGLNFLSFFVPHGVPSALLLLMIPIELISYLARPVSLSVRLFANMTAGHTVLGVLFFFTVSLDWYGAWVPFGFSVVFNAFEMFIGLIQAYIFTILTCVYINDSIHMH
ncbi:MAG: F0F1 ATP synthase subunit A [Magnetococcales bacterium]|nr:F0F1 ATP synthase subunit A [Magnetococcales bacterium]